MDGLFVILLICFCVSKRVASNPCETSTDGIHVDCSHRGLTKIPEDIQNASFVTSLDLSGNNISHLAASEFYEFRQLTKLNLSATGILTVDEKSLEGLDTLKVLDLTNNPFLWYHSRIPNDLLASTKQIRKLYISGGPVNGSLFRFLENLEEIRMTPHKDYMPYELVQLKKLRVLNFAFGHLKHISQAMLQPFSKSAIEEIAFHHCNISTVEEGAFVGFKSLRLINFACNEHANTSILLDALSSSNISIDSLVLDAVGIKNFWPAVVFGNPQNGECQQFWRNLKNLSMRGVTLSSLQRPDCFQSMRKLVAGFSSSYYYNVNWMDIMKMKQLRYLDVSYLKVHDHSSLKHDSGCFRSRNWIPPNDYFFPKKHPEWHDEQCDPEQTDTYQIVDDHPNPCNNLSIPPCLESVSAHHMSLIGNSFTDSCTRISKPNNLRYLDASYKMDYNYWNANKTRIIGLDKLEILDLRGFKMKDMNSEILYDLPSLRELYLGNNQLGKGTSLATQTWPKLGFLEIVDLSDNQIYSLNSKLFANLTSLQKLYLNDNHLDGVEWLQPNLHTLNLLNLLNNRVQYFTSDTITGLPYLSNNSQLVIVLEGNPLQCGCTQIDFLTWTKDTKTQLDVDKLMCPQSGERAPMTDLSVDELHHECYSYFHKYVIIGVVVAFVMFFITCSVLAYKIRRSRVLKYDAMVM